MKALLKKDLLVLARQMKFYLLLILVFSIIPNFPGAAFAIVYAAMLPITSISFDENAKWGNLAVMMPYTPQSLVGCKYVLGYLCLGSVAALTLLAQLLMGTLRKSGALPESVATIALSILMALIMLATILL